MDSSVLRTNVRPCPGPFGVHQYAITPGTPNGAYTETDSHTITFPGAVLQEGDLVTTVIGKIVTNVTRTVGVSLGNYRTTIDGQRIVTLPSGMYYDPGVNNLEVYVDGRLKLQSVAQNLDDVEGPLENELALL